MEHRVTVPTGRRRLVRWFYGLAAYGLLTGLSAQEWTRFRGPDGTGVGRGDAIPASFTKADFNWQVKLPGAGPSSPVLWGNRIFLTCAHDDAGRREVVCIDSASGEQIWSWDTPFEAYRHNRMNSFAASTPAVDAERVYLTWISGGRFVVLALDHAGKQVWLRELGSFKARHGAGTSPVVVGATVVVCNDNASGDSFLIGLDVKTGNTRWRHDRKSQTASYITPTLHRREGKPVELIFLSPPHGISGVDPETGALNWEVPGPFTQKSVASPVVAGDLIFASAGRGGGGTESAAVRPGDGAQVVYEIKADLPYVPTPIAVGELLFILSDSGAMSCVEAASGKLIWRQQLNGKHFSSPVSVNGRIYCVSRAGEVTVIEAGPEYKLLARNTLPEGTDATPAIANGCMYFRTKEHLIGIGGK